MHHSEHTYKTTEEAYQRIEADFRCSTREYSDYGKIFRKRKQKVASYSRKLQPKALAY